MPDEKQQAQGSELSDRLDGLTLRFNADPICPYCGKAYRDAWEIDFHGEMEGSTEITCGGCEREFFVERNVEVTYNTAPLENEEPA